MTMQCTAENEDIHAQKRRKGRISPADVEAMAQLIAKRITETGACNILGIKWNTWISWKQRAKNSHKFAQLLERVRELQIKGHIECIEDAARGLNGHRPDWRASQALLVIKAPERYATRSEGQQAATTQPGITLEQMHKVLAHIAAQQPAQPVIDCQPVKQLGEAGQETPP